MESKFAHLPDIRTTQPERLIKWRVSDDRFSAEVLLPGFAYTDFDQKIGGKLPLRAITELFLIGRLNAASKGLNAGHVLLGRDTTVFVASQFYELEKAMSEICLANAYETRTPIKIIVYVSRLGKTSLSTVTELYDANTRIKLGSNVTNFVQININSRRPVTIQHEKFVGIDSHLEKLVRFRHIAPKRSIPTLPESAYEYTLRASFSEMDENQHVTQNSYVTWSSDAASVGATSGHFRQFTKPIGMYPVKEIESHYLSEVLMGEIVVMYVWEDDSVANRLHFVGKKGKLSMWALSKLGEAIRWQGLRNGLAYYPETVRSKQRALFVVGQTVILEKEVHDIRYSDAFGKHFPIRCYINLSDVGNSSYVVAVTWVDNETGKYIATFTTKVVLVSKDTRKPMPLPDLFFKGTDLHFNTFDRLPMERMPKTSIPESAFVYDTRVLHSDTDMNGHVNQSIFFTWSSDAASSAAIQGRLKHFKRHIELYPYKSIHVQHIGEAMVNDVVNVLVWEKDNARSIYVVIKVKGANVFEMIIDFHEGGPTAVSPHLESQL